MKRLVAWFRAARAPRPSPPWTCVITQSLWLTGGGTGFVVAGAYYGHALERMSSVQLSDKLARLDVADPVSAALLRRWVRCFRDGIAGDIIEDADAGTVDFPMTPARARRRLGVADWADAGELHAAFAACRADDAAPDGESGHAGEALHVLLRRVRHR